MYVKGTLAVMAIIAGVSLSTSAPAKSIKEIGESADRYKSGLEQTRRDQAERIHDRRELEHDKAEAKHNLEEAKRNLKNGNVDGALRDIDGLKRNGRKIEQGRQELQGDRRKVQFDQFRNSRNKEKFESDLGIEQPKNRRFD
jgi:hypothetical protein